MNSSSFFIGSACARTFARFVLVGGLCYLLNVLILIVAVESLGIHYVPANLISLAALVLIGHRLHRRKTFRTRGAYLPELSRFAVAVAAQTLAAIALMAVLVEYVGMNYVAANFAVTVAFTLISFLIQRDLVFRSSGSTNHMLR